MLSSILLFIAGFALLLKGADVLTDRAAAIAKKLNISHFITGIVIVGIGTSIPEMIITIFSNLQGVSRMGIGTIVGSNTFNILFILGISALITPLILTERQVWRHLPLNIFAVAISAIFVLFSVTGLPGLSRAEGLTLLFFFVLWMFYLYKINKTTPDSAGEQNFGNKSHSHFSNFVFLILGILGIFIGGEWVTQSSINLAKIFGLSESIIGLTIVGLGTSLPELAASAVAAYKKEYGIAVGNIIGSNIFDFLMILGLASAMKPMIFTESLLFDMIVTLFSAVLLFGAMFIGRKYVLKRWQGLVFILLYVLYIGYLFSIRP